MSDIQKHKIHTASLQVDFEGMEEGLGVQDSIGLLFHEKIKPALEKAFDKYADPKATIVFDKLELDCGQISYQNWEEDIVKQILIQLEENLKSLPKEKKEIISVEKKAEEVFIHFLEKGFFPWNSLFSSPQYVEKAIVIEAPFIENLKKTFQKSSASLERLFLTYSPAFISKIFGFLTQKSNPKIVSLVNYFQSQAPFVQKELMVVLLISSQHQDSTSFASFLKTLIVKFSKENLSFLAEYFCRERIVVDEFLGVYNSLLLENEPTDFKAKLSYLVKIMVNTDLRILGENGISGKGTYLETAILNTIIGPKNNPKPMPKKDIEKRTRPGKSFEEKENITDPKISNIQRESKHQLEPEIGEGIYIENAGLVLLHPFLTGLFANLQLTENGKFVAESDQSLAARLLQFLVFGENELAENFYPLNKIICGMGIFQVLGEEIQITKESKTECEDLLQAVIGHWSVLKNTSIYGLRETFLQRAGKISRVEKVWKLQVERKTVDVLLDKLPWGLGIVKLPWMDDMMFVEWE